MKLDLWFLQASVDSLDDVTFVLLEDAFVDVRVHLLVHEVPQLGEVLILNRTGADQYRHLQAVSERKSLFIYLFISSDATKY